MILPNYKFNKKNSSFFKEDALNFFKKNYFENEKYFIFSSLPSIFNKEGNNIHKKIIDKLITRKNIISYTYYTYNIFKNIINPSPKKIKIFSKIVFLNFPPAKIITYCKKK